MKESLKNMLLVMSADGIFESIDETSAISGSAFWELTWHEVDKFLPNLKGELFPEKPFVIVNGNAEKGIEELEVRAVTTSEPSEANVNETTTVVPAIE